ncbi:MAG TPA: hypothetical protein VFT22_07280 [Kofleriaceae bacterium]|nr:hypothetical protein [Kofleriaceae bacterium]
MAPAPPDRPNGGDGVVSYGGLLATNERNSELSGARKWINYANAVNMAIVATGVRYRCDLLAGTKWSAVPNERGGALAQQGAEIVERGLLQAQMDTPWSSIVRKASLYKLFGFSLHEWIAKPIGDAGSWVYTEIAHRPQHTIDRWNKPSEQLPWDAVGQLTPAGNTYTIERPRLFYCVDNLLTEQPDGVGLLRHCAQLVQQLMVLEGLEGFAFETDLRGIPIGRAPFRELRKDAETSAGKTGSDVEAEVFNRTNHIRQFLQNLIKSPDKLQYLFLDSSTYQGLDPNVISGVQRWAVELMKGHGNGLAELDVAIRRKQLEIARVLGIEFALLGGSDAGSWALSADKTSLFATSLQATLSELAAFATRDLARPLIGLNGLDPDLHTPTLIAQPISTEAVADTCKALQALASAALTPDDPAIDVIRERLHLPPAPKPTVGVLGLLGSEPDPESVDVNLDGVEDPAEPPVPAIAPETEAA